MAAKADLALIKHDVVDVVSNKVRGFMESGELRLPPNYSPENSLKSAWLILQTLEDKDKRLALETCTKNSIANSLLDMVVQGLNPAKRQCYFLPYGNRLVCQRSYFGDMALVRRVLPNSDIWYGVVYEGDEFSYEIERGRKRITKHLQSIDHVAADKIVAAYCVIEPGGDADPITEIMTIDQIRNSWKNSKQYNPDGGTTPHYTFTDQMALRTVIRRACKAVINSSSDDYLLLHHVHRSDDVVAEAEMDEEVAEYANGPVIDVDMSTEFDPDPEPEPEPEPSLGHAEQDTQQAQAQKQPKQAAKSAAKQQALLAESDEAPF